MRGFTPNLILKHIYKNHETIWVLEENLKYKADDGTVFIIRKGFETDLGSIPRIFWGIFPPHWSYAKACVLHDYLLKFGMEPSKANLYLKEAMYSLNVNKARIHLMFFSVSAYFFVKKFIKKYN